MNLKKLINDWWTSTTWAFQGGHFLQGMVFAMLPYWAWGNLSHSALSSIAAIAWFIVKETVIDVWAEGDPFDWKGGRLDLTCQTLGVTAAWAIKLAIGGWAGI